MRTWVEKGKGGITQPPRVLNKLGRRSKDSGTLWDETRCVDCEAWKGKQFISPRSSWDGGATSLRGLSSRDET